MQRTHEPSAMPVARMLGITPGNPFAPWVTLSLAAYGGALIVLLAVILSGAPTETRYHAGLALIAVGSLGPIPIALLVINSRGYVRIQDMIVRNHLVHWRYPWPLKHPGLRGDEVYIGYQGILWPARRFRLIDFKSGLLGVDVMPEELIFHYRERRYTTFGSYALNREARVPIPSGREDEAAALAAKLRARLGIPSETLSEQWMIGIVMGVAIVVMVIVGALLTLPIEFTRTREQAEARSVVVAATREAYDMLLNDALQPIDRVIMPQIRVLKAAGARAYSPEELGFSPGDNVREVTTGFCRTSDSFYVLVWEHRPTVRGLQGSQGVYHYVDGDWLEACMPEEWVPDGLYAFSDDWYYVFLRPNPTLIATALAEEYYRLLTPSPSP